ncbi:hypothetical protein [Oceanobacter antarcticus]|uniref:LVIVD repeat-containing protein n=1 Tax=Oceanobacter antarcticus TaxID=3133425 RepID=A0ABW8NL84_9GAMM
MKHGRLFLLSLLALVAVLSGCGADTDSANGADGTAGSTSRFTIQRGFLIVSDSSMVKSFLIDSETGALYEADSVYVNREIETVFPYGADRVFLGTTTGTLIVHVGAEGYLTYETGVDHARSCDPVIANGNTMYVTLSNGSGSCGGTEYDNHLMIYDITNLYAPTLRGLVAIDEPTGLALDGDNLFVCYAGGLKRFDVSGSWSAVETGDYADLACNDIIIDEEADYLTTDDGVLLVNLSDDTPVLLSTIREGQ